MTFKSTTHYLPRSDPRRERRGRGRDARLWKPEGRGSGEEERARRAVRGGARGQDQVVRAESLLQGQVRRPAHRVAQDTFGRDCGRVGNQAHGFENSIHTDTDM